MLTNDIKATLIDHMGSDLSTVNAARVSFKKQHNTFDPATDTKLVNYLADHRHYSPFKHSAMSFHVKAPIFVARQLVKSEYLVMNEVSRRYVEDEVEFYVPDGWRERAPNKKQGSLGLHPSPLVQEVFDGNYKASMTSQLALYNRMLDEGIAPEQARMVLPLSLMTEWYWTGLTAAFAKMCTLRLKDDTQYETRLVAQQIDKAARELFPVSWAALV